MPIIKGSTPTIRVVLSTDEVEFDTITKVYLTFAQKETTITALNTTFLPEDAELGEKTITFKKKLTQAETLALTEDIDLVCQIDVLTTNSDRKVSKIFSFGVCHVLRNEVLS